MVRIVEMGVFMAESRKPKRLMSVHAFVCIDNFTILTVALRWLQERIMAHQLVS